MRPCTACWRFRCHAACFLAWAGSSGFGFCCPGDTEYYGRIAAAQAHYHGAQQYVGSGEWTDDIQYHHALCGNQPWHQFRAGMDTGTVPEWPSGASGFREARMDSSWRCSDLLKQIDHFAVVEMLVVSTLDRLPSGFSDFLPHFRMIDQCSYL